MVTRIRKKRNIEQPWEGIMKSARLLARIGKLYVARAANSQYVFQLFQEDRWPLYIRVWRLTVAIHS